MARFGALEKMRFFRVFQTTGDGREAWIQAFGDSEEYSKEKLNEYLSDPDVQDFNRKALAEVQATGGTQTEIMLELDRLQKEAAEIKCESDDPKDKLDAIKTQMKAVEMKARVTKKLGEKQEIALQIALPVSGDEKLLKMMEERKKITDSEGFKRNNETIDAEFEEVNVSK